LTLGASSKPSTSAEIKLAVASKSSHSAPKLSPEQRAQLRAWMVDEGVDDYRGIQALLEEHGFPALSRGGVHYYRRHFVTQRKCPTCGRPFARRATPRQSS
jgi:hypothetical protein